MTDKLDYENENLDDEHLDEEEDFKEVILTLDDDTELKCLVIAQYDVNKQDYIALLPIEDDEPSEILLYRATYGEDETFDVSLIEDEEEFQVAADAYYNYIEEEEIDVDSIDYHEHHHHHKEEHECKCGHHHHEEEHECKCGHHHHEEEHKCNCEHKHE